MTSHAAPNPHHHDYRTLPCHREPNHPRHRYSSPVGWQTESLCRCTRVQVPLQRLRARWNGRKSKQEVVPRNRKLKEHEELAVCAYLDRLDEIGLHARLFMIADRANAVLRRAHVDEGSPPQVSEHWGRRFLERHPEYHVHKQSVQEIDRKKAQDPSTIQWWLHEFKRIRDEYGVQQCDIYKKNTSFKRQANELWDYPDPTSPTYM